VVQLARSDLGAFQEAASQVFLDLGLGRKGFILDQGISKSCVEIADMARVMNYDYTSFRELLRLERASRVI